MKISSNLIRRIMIKVTPKLEGCWQWQGATVSGYPAVHQDGRRGSIVLAHQIVCEIYHGQRPAGEEVRHLCNNRACLNPAHLCWGTHTQNMLDIPLDQRVKNVHNATIASAIARRKRTR